MNSCEKKILKILRKRHVLKRSEIKSIVGNEKVEKTIKSLINKGLITYVPFMESYVAITQKGMRELEE